MRHKHPRSSVGILKEMFPREVVSKNSKSMHVRFMANEEGYHSK